MNFGAFTALMDLHLVRQWTRAHEGARQSSIGFTYRFRKTR